PGGCRTHCRLQRQHRRQVLAMQPLREEMERLARLPAIGLGEPDEPIDEDPPRTNLGGLGKEHAVGLQQLLLKDLSRREDHLQAPVTLEPLRSHPKSAASRMSLSGATSNRTITPG